MWLTKSLPPPIAYGDSLPSGLVWGLLPPILIWGGLVFRRWLLLRNRVGMQRFNPLQPSLNQRLDRTPVFGCGGSKAVEGVNDPVDAGDDFAIC